MCVSSYGVPTLMILEGLSSDGLWKYMRLVSVRTHQRFSHRSVSRRFRRYPDLLVFEPNVRVNTKTTRETGRRGHTGGRQEQDDASKKARIKKTEPEKKTKK